MGGVELLPQFRHDLIQQYCWYADERDEALAQQFKAAVTATIAFVHSQPNIGPACRFVDKSLAGIRYFRIEPPFEKWLIFYRVGNDRLQAIRLLHGMRDLPRRLKEQ